MSPVEFLFLLLQESLHLNPLSLLRIGLLPALAQAGIDLLGGALLGLLLPGGVTTIVLAALLLHMAAQCVPLHDLLCLVSQYHCVKTLECPPSHDISRKVVNCLLIFQFSAPKVSLPDAFFLNTEALYLIVDVEEEAVVARAVVAWSHQEAARSSSHQQVDRLVFAQVPVEPGEDGVGIYRFLQVTEQVLVEQH